MKRSRKVSKVLKTLWGDFVSLRNVFLLKFLKQQQESFFWNLLVLLVVENIENIWLATSELFSLVSMKRKKKWREIFTAFQPCHWHSAGLKSNLSEWSFKSAQPKITVIPWRKAQFIRKSQKKRENRHLNWPLFVMKVKGNASKQAFALF